MSSLMQWKAQLTVAMVMLVPAAVSKSVFVGGTGRAGMALLHWDPPGELSVATQVSLSQTRRETERVTLGKRRASSAPDSRSPERWTSAQWFPLHM